MLPWIKSVFNEVIEASVDLANEYEPEEAADVEETLPETENSEEQANSTHKKRDRSYSTPVNTHGGLVFRTKSQGHPVLEKKNIFQGAEPLNLGVTPLLIEYVSNLCQHPDTWIDFPVEEILQQKSQKAAATASTSPSNTIASENITESEIHDTQSYQLTDKEEAHAVAVLQAVPQLSELRYQLVPRQMDDERFWRVYFLLVSNKFQLSDSDENFRMPELQKSEDSLQYNSFYSTFASDKPKATKLRSSSSGDAITPPTYSFARKGSETLSIEHPPSLLGEGPVYWWHANEHGSRKTKYKETFLHPSHGQQGASSNWTKMNLTLLKQDRPKIFKLLLRCGVPDEFRAKAWKSSPSLSICVKQEEITTPRRLLSRARQKQIETKTETQSYDFLLKEIFGEEVPLSCNPIPTFGGNISFHQRHYLSNGGVLATRRILILISLKTPQLHFAPILTDLVPLLMSFMAEDNVYELANILISESLERCHYIPLGNRHLELFGIAFVRLVQEFFPDVALWACEIGVDLKELFISWSSCLFVGYLPYQTVLRMMDCLLYEGSTVMYRIALGLISKYKTELQQQKSSEEFKKILKLSMAQELDADALFSISWKCKVKHEHLVELYNSIVEEGELLEVPEHEMEIIRLPNPHTISVPTLENFETIWTWIPQRYRLHDPRIIFNSQEDGFNLRTLISKCSDYIPSLLIVKTKDQKILGAFCDQVWEVQDHYYGSGESFLFSLFPHEKLFRWCPDANQCYIRVTSTEVAFGGGKDGDGLRLDEELLHGQSYRSETYNNDPLHCSGDPEFECATVEVYVFD